MAFWRHVTVDTSRRLSFLYERWYISLGYGEMKLLDSRPGDSAGQPVRTRDGMQLMASRFFAAPVQARPREEPYSTQGPRLNEAITAKFIRLVTDEGHGVVSRDEALDRARRLTLDLVEVQRTAKPPVCKIMDYHKEKYKKETMEKERAKSKSESTVRKGDFKEVRLKGKIEQKDLEVKAEVVKGLIERGYRVKCMALPSKQRGVEEADLGALLSRLMDLIEAVMVVESGPFVEKQQAYVVVRHVKFGSKKGSRKKATRVVETTPGTERTVSPLTLDSATPDLEVVEPMETNGETDDDVLSEPEDHVQDLPMSPFKFDSGADRNVISSSLTGKLDSLGRAISGMTETSPASIAVSSSVKPKLGSERDQMEGRVPPNTDVSRPDYVSRSDFSSEYSNRYSRRIEIKSRPDQAKPARRNAMVDEVKGTSKNYQISPTTESNNFNRLAGKANPGWVERRRPNQGSILRQRSSYENRKQEHMDINVGQMPPNNGSAAPSYGIFSSPKPSISGGPRKADVNREKEQSSLSSNKYCLNTPKSKVETTEQNNEGPNKGHGAYSTDQF